MVDPLFKLLKYCTLQSDNERKGVHTDLSLLGFLVFIGCAEPFLKNDVDKMRCLARLCTGYQYNNHQLRAQPHGRSNIQTFEILHFAIRQWMTWTITDLPKSYGGHWKKKSAHRFFVGLGILKDLMGLLNPPFEKLCRQNAWFSTFLHSIPEQPQATVGSKKDNPLLHTYVMTYL